MLFLMKLRFNFFGCILVMSGFKTFFIFTIIWKFCHIILKTVLNHKIILKWNKNGLKKHLKPIARSTF